MNLSVFLPITKVDAVNRTVYGKFTEEFGDRSGEIMDYTTSKPLFQKWSEDMYGASGGKNFGNIRAMHKNVAAGLVCQPLDFDDNGRAIGGLARIVDDDEWRKVEEGVYTGFSVGGRYVKRWTDRDNPRLIRYTAEPSEVSLVDLPCVPGATFQFIKADGAAEDRAFASSVTAPALSDAPDGKVDSGNSLWKEGLSGEIKPSDPPHGTIRPPETGKASTEGYTDKRTSTDPGNLPTIMNPTDVDPGERNQPVEMGHPDKATPPSNVRKDDVADGGTNGEDVAQVWKAKDGETFTRKADAIKHNQQLDIDDSVDKASSAAHAAVDELSELLTGKAATPDKKPPTAGTGGTKVPIKRSRIGASGSGDDSADTTQAAQQGGSKVPVKKSALIEKTLYDIGRVACIIDELKWVKECIVMEEALEQDNSPLPAAATEALDTLCKFLLAMVKEEVDEIMSGTDVQSEDIEDDTNGSAGVILVIKQVAEGMNVDYRKALRSIEGLPEAFQDELSKAASKLTDEQMMHVQSAHDHVAAASGGDACVGDDDMGKLAAVDKARLKTAHDHLGAMGATCKAAKMAFTTNSPLRKGLSELTDADLNLENLNLPAPILKLLGKTNGLEFQLGKLGSTVSDLVKQVKVLKDMPMPGKGVTKFTAIAKGQDIGSGGDGQLSPDDQAIVTAYNDRLSKMNETDRAKELIKLSLAQPVFHME
jgi:hypothetical protein